jgi:hypothetical protein
MRRFRGYSIRQSSVRLTINWIYDPCKFIRQLHLPFRSVRLLADAGTQRQYQTLLPHRKLKNPQLVRRVLFTDGLADECFNGLIDLRHELSTQENELEVFTDANDDTCINGVGLDIQRRVMRESFRLSVLDHLSCL